MKMSVNHRFHIVFAAITAVALNSRCVLADDFGGSPISDSIYAAEAGVGSSNIGIIADSGFYATPYIILSADDTSTAHNFMSFANTATGIVISDAGGSSTTSADTFTVLYGGQNSLKVAGNAITLSGAANLTSTLGVSGAASLGSTLSVSGLSTLNGINNTNDGITNAGAISGVTTLTTSGAATLGSTLGVNGSLTAAGAVNTIGTAGVSANTLTGTTNAITAATSNTMGVTGGAAVTTTATSAAVQTADGHGLTVDETTHTTTLSGGTNSSTLTLTDAQATLGVGTAATPEITVLDAANDGTTTSVTIGGSDNASNTLDATADGGTNTIIANAANGTNTLSAATNIITSNDGSGGTNSITVTATQQGNIDGNLFDYGTAVDGGMLVNGDLGVTGTIYTTGISNNGSGIADVGALSGVTTFSASGAAAFGSTLSVAGTSTLNGIDNSNAGITNAGAISGVTTLTTSGAAAFGSTLSVAGTATLNGIDNSSAGITNAGAISGVTTLTTSGAAAFGSTLGVSGNLTASGTTNTIGTAGVSTNTLTGTANVLTSSDGAGGSNTLTVTQTQNGTVNGSTFAYGTHVDGGMLISGDLGVDGHIYSLDATADSGMTVGNNGLFIEGDENTVTLQADNDALNTNARANLVMTPTTAGLTVTTDSGIAHGITIDQTRTVITGGTQSTSLTLDDDGATFRNEDTGGPARVTGVANGVGTYDAVNMGQFRHLEGRVDKAYAGIASVSAIAAVPAPVPGKDVSVGLGFGQFENYSAVAVGAKALVGKKKDITVTAGAGYADTAVTFSAGIGWSF